MPWFRNWPTNVCQKSKLLPLNLEADANSNI